MRQDQSRLQILQQLDTSSVFITQDWAMKYLPRKYRESQSDWYGKKGISCHISVAVRRRNDHLESQGRIHVIQNCSQGSCAVVAIMAHVLKTLKQENPEIQRAFFSPGQRWLLPQRCYSSDGASDCARIRYTGGRAGFL